MKITMQNLKLKANYLFLLLFLMPFSTFACVGRPAGILGDSILPFFIVAVIFLLLSFFIKRKNQKISRLFIILFSLLTLISLGISYVTVLTFFVFFRVSIPAIFIMTLLYIASRFFKDKNKTIHNICYSLFIIFGLIILSFILFFIPSLLTSCSSIPF